MKKLAENKTRKRLRISLCICYLLEIVMCSLPYYQYSNNGKLITNSVFEMLSALGTGNIDTVSEADFHAATTILPMNFIFVIIPIIGFFFCALDKERNMKNIVSLLCCLAGVVSILLIVTVNLLSLGSMLSLLLYILISFLSTISMMARVAQSK